MVDVLVSTGALDRVVEGEGAALDLSVGGAGTQAHDARGDRGRRGHRNGW